MKEESEHEQGIINALYQALASPAKTRNFLAYMDAVLKKAAGKGEYTEGELHTLRSNRHEFIEEFHRLAHDFVRRKMTPVFDLAGMLKLLGQVNVITPAENCATFKLAPPKDQIVVCPSLEQMRECAKQNKANNNNWMLVYASALSFRDQHSILGTDKRPNYSADVDWFLRQEEKEWADAKPEAGFYLLDMTPRWKYTHWQGQENNIAMLGEDFHRADERVFAQAIFAHMKAGRRLFGDAWHWGCLPDSDGNRIMVFADKAGFRVGNEHPSKHGFGMMFVCVARKSRDQALII